MITNFKQFNENLLVPRNLESRKEKLKQMNIRLLSQEVIDGDLKFDDSFMDIDAKFVKLNKVNGDVMLTGTLWTEIPEWLKDVKIEGDFDCSENEISTLKNLPLNIGEGFNCSHNRLSSLEGCPEIIVGDFDCSHNQLSSLEGCPENIEGDFFCFDNEVELKLPGYVKLEGGFYK